MPAEDRLDPGDLDSRFYRIMNLKAAEITAFLNAAWNRELEMYDIESTGSNRRVHRNEQDILAPRLPESILTPPARLP